MCVCACVCVWLGVACVRVRGCVSPLPTILSFAPCRRRKALLSTLILAMRPVRERRWLVKLGREGGQAARRLLAAGARRTQLRSGRVQGEAHGKGHR